MVLIKFSLTFLPPTSNQLLKFPAPQKIVKSFISLISATHSVLLCFNSPNKLINFKLDVKLYEFYFVGCWVFTYAYNCVYVYFLAFLFFYLFLNYSLNKAFLIPFYFFYWAAINSFLLL